MSRHLLHFTIIRVNMVYLTRANGYLASVQEKY